MINSTRLLIALALLAFALGGCDLSHVPGDGHDHADDSAPAASQRPGTPDNHAEDDADDHADEADGHDEADDHAGEPDAHAADAGGSAHVELTADQRRQMDLHLATAAPGAISVTATSPGEIMPDPDRVAHIVPRAAGIVRETSRSLGDYVEANEILAWIESDELAEAKLAFYARHAEVGCCQVELPRALEIFENTNRLLALLEKEPSAEELAALDEMEMGEHRGQLLTAYAAYTAARSTLQREQALFDKSISSESEFIQAEAAFKKARAEYAAARDIARYQVLIAYTEAAQKRQVAEFEAVAAGQRLRLKGVGEDVLAGLLALVPQTANLEPCLCDDPNCREGEMPSVLETLGEEERLGWYALRAPFAGYITERHLPLGEKVGDEEPVMTITDLSSVWVQFNVYQKDLPHVMSGQAARIELGPGLPAATGTVAYVAPIIDRETRTARARIELDNPDGVLRPGLYATVHVDIEAVAHAVVIEKAAVQLLDDEEVVFVEDGDGFTPVPVRLGMADGEQVAVLDGLKSGQRYVEHGAFELKAQIVTSGIDPHAGHGH